MVFGGSRTAVLDMTGGDMEKGEWYYIVTDSSGFTTRRKPSSKKSEKTLLRLGEGEVVRVIQRSARAQDGARYLLLGDEMGWAFDREPGIFNRERLRELHTEYGDWCYRAVDSAGIQVLNRPRFLKRQSNIPVDCIKCGEYLDVDKTIQCGCVQFLHLADRPGWIMNNVERTCPSLLGPIPVNPEGNVVSENYEITVPMEDPDMMAITITRPQPQGTDAPQQTCAVRRKSAW